MTRAWALMTLLSAAVAACSNGGGSTSGGETPAGTFVDANGTVSNPISASQTGHLIVGLVKPTDASQRINCAKLIVKYENASATLPAPFRLQRVPAGDYVLLALLIDSSGAAQMPGAAYEVTADASGVQLKNAASQELKIAMQGTIGYDCP